MRAARQNAAADGVTYVRDREGGRESSEMEVIRPGQQRKER